MKHCSIRTQHVTRSRFLYKLGFIVFQSCSALNKPSLPLVLKDKGGSLAQDGLTSSPASLSLASD